MGFHKNLAWIEIRSSYAQKQNPAAWDSWQKYFRYWKIRSTKKLTWNFFSQLSGGTALMHSVLDSNYADHWETGNYTRKIGRSHNAVIWWHTSYIMKVTQLFIISVRLKDFEQCIIFLESTSLTDVLSVSMRLQMYVQMRSWIRNLIRGRYCWINIGTPSTIKACTKNTNKLLCRFAYNRNA